jgi:hypothetical protein
MRNFKQDHVSFAAPWAAIEARDLVSIARDFQDSHKPNNSNQISGPGIIESVIAGVFASANFDWVVNHLRSFILYHLGRADLMRGCLETVTGKVPA